MIGEALHPGDRVRLVRPGWGDDEGATGVYEGGADYVPGLDAGCFTVKLDKPNRFGHLAAAHWTYVEVCETWEKIPE